jgi:hypothetical protein
MANQIELIYAKQAEKQLKEVLDGLTKIHVKQMDLQKNAIDFYGGRASSNPQELNTVIAKYDELAKRYADLEAKTKRLNETKAKANQRTSEEIVNQRALAQASDRQARANSALVGAYARLNAQHQQARINLQNLIASQTASNAEIRKAQKEYNVLDARINKADHAVKVFNRNVGNYPKQALSGLTSLASAFGLVGGAMLFAGAVKDAFRTIKEFDKANADLAATMGLNRSQISALTNDQKRLGASTKFTASEVAKLQKEFAKLGFSQNEILNATEATLALAAAVDTDLENAAMVAGSTLRGFGLDASEMGRVTDVMASSFTKSALDVENFRESMKYVAPIAKSTGTSIEFTTAMLGKLADAGIKGSQAGTSLRRILSEMANTGLPASQALDKVAKSGLTVKDAMDEVGRNAQTALLVLSQSKDGIGLLADELERAGGAAQKMANEQLQSLEGKLTILASAWDGFVLSLVKGDGALSKFFVGAIEGLTKLLGMLTNANKSLNDFKTEVFSGAQGDVPKELVKNVEEYLELLRKRNVSEEQINDERQKKILEYAKRELNNQKILLHETTKNLGAFQSVLEEQERKSANLITGGFFNAKNLTRARKNVEESSLAIERYKGAIKGLEGLIQQTLNPTKQQTEVIEENTDKTNKNTKAKKEAEIYAVGSVKWLKEQISKLQELNDTQSLTNEEYEVGVGAIKFYQQWLERLTGTVKKLKDETSEGVQLDLGGVEFLTDEEGDELRRQGDELRAWYKDFRKSFEDDFWANSGFDKINFIIENFDKLKESGTDMALALSEAFQQAFNTISSYSDANFQRMYTNLEQQRDVSILFAGESATAREEIDRVYEERRKRIQRQQAEAQKRMAMFNIAVNTAQAIVSALASTPPNIPLSIAVGVIGAAQLALTASQPIPEFYKGTQNAPAGLAWTDERGAELHTDKSGKIKDLGSNKGARLKKLDKGDKIYTASQTKKILDLYSFNKEYDNIMLTNGIAPPPPQVNNYLNLEPLKAELQSLKSVIANKSEVTIVNNESGTRYYERVNGQRRELVNSVLTLKTRSVR